MISVTIKIMENRSWNSSNISLEKETLKNDELDMNLDTEEIRSVAKSNEDEIKGSLAMFPNLDNGVVSFFENNTSVDGAVNISGINLLSKFFARGGVCFHNDKTITTRGYDYICSLDASLTSLQKIKKYEETVYAVIESLKEPDINKLEKILLLDYLKNSLITILNSFVYQEKLGSQNIDTSKEYNEIRGNLITHVESVIGVTVDLVLDKDMNDTQGINFDTLIAVTHNSVNKLSDYHSEYKLPGFYVSRPEATHPLTIMGASLLCAERYKNVNVVIGVPSGGTEFALTIKVFLDKLGNKDVNLFLTPISLHSLKQFSGEVSNHETTFLSLPSLNNTNSVLICDDNTSTGKTLQVLKDSITKHYPNITVYCAVAEADIVRSKIDENSKNRTHIANKNIYADSVNILPVSRSISPKTDLKEIIEKKKIIRYYRDMEERSLNAVDQIYARVMSRVNEVGVDYTNLEKENTISDFHGTFLSNFYVAPVTLNNVVYPTVEHAYQSAKFFNLDWNKIQAEAKDEIKEALKCRGYVEPVVYGNELFADSTMTAGNIKIIADILRKYDYVDKDWEDQRIKIMIELLLQKFGEQEMFDKLQETGNKELVEGNNWGDTLWGVSEGKGRNILGVILMDIRHNISVD